MLIPDPGRQGRQVAIDPVSARRWVQDYIIRDGEIHVEGK